MTLTLLSSELTKGIRARGDVLRPYIGLIGVLLGAMMGTLGNRVTSFGLADLRGALHAGFDEGAWITTAYAVGQMMMGVASSYLGAVYGVRRVLLVGIVTFFMASLLGPLSSNLEAYLAMQFLGGLGSGTFIPLTVSYIRKLPVNLVIFGVAIFAMNVEMSQNIAASLEGRYADNLSWHWVHWQYCLALPAMYFCVSYGVPGETGATKSIRELDWPGLLYAGVGFSMLYAALDQGNRLDWLNSGVISGLLLGGGLCVTLFILRELSSKSPFLNVRLLANRTFLPLLSLLAGFRFIILSTGFIIPAYLQTVQNFRELQVGSVLLWIALPQLAIVIPLGAFLKRFDPRYVLAFGNLLIGIACLMATQLTSVWATEDFLPSQIVQAFGQSFALTALLVLVVRSMPVAAALTFGSLLQITRLFGGEMGTAFMQTLIRVREQVHSNILGQHVDPLRIETIDRLAALRAATPDRTADATLAASRSIRLLSDSVAQQSSVLSYIDGFWVAALGTAICLLLVAFVKRPVNPAF